MFIRQNLKYFSFSKFGFDFAKLFKFLKALQCASHGRVRLRGVHHSAESDSAVCITQRSQAPQCASLRKVKLRGVHHNAESIDEEFSKAPRCASYRRVKLCGVHHTLESITYQVSVLIGSFMNAISL